jgi:S-adenosylmethionine-diacylglycerol 3-amino-3-carboxypropyl transferase
MPLAAFEKLLRETIRVAKHGSVITYRNLLVPRSRPQSLATWIKPRIKIAEKLHGKDLSFIYRAYRVEQIDKSYALPS